MKEKIVLSTFIVLFFIGTKNITAQQENDNKNIANLIKKKRSYNKKHGMGFRIQVYYGEEKKAKRYLSKFKSKFPGTYAKLDYSSPYWNVKVGSYRSMLDADRALNKIREKFSGAIVVEK